MNLDEKQNELINILEQYLSGKVENKLLLDFAWEVIDYFSKDKNILPEEKPFENEFWFAIWQMQHLLEEPDSEIEMIKRELKKSLSYLKQEVDTPVEVVGRRP